MEIPNVPKYEVPKDLTALEHEGQAIEEAKAELQSGAQSFDVQFVYAQSWLQFGDHSTYMPACGWLPACHLRPSNATSPRAHLLALERDCLCFPSNRLQSL